MKRRTLTKKTNPTRGGPPTLYPGKGTKAASIKLTDEGWQRAEQLQREHDCSLADAIEGRLRGDF